MDTASTAPTPAATTSAMSGKTMLIVAVVLVGAFLLYKSRK